MKLERSKRPTLTNECNIYTTGRKGSAFGCPPETILENPGVKVVLCFLTETEIGIGDTLEDVVVVLRRTEDGW